MLVTLKTKFKVPFLCSGQLSSSSVFSFDMLSKHAAVVFCDTLDSYVIPS